MKRFLLASSFLVFPPTALNCVPASFVKIDTGGKILRVDAKEWNCVRDNITGLSWEVKSSDKGLHSKWHSYTWFNPAGRYNGGNEGREGEADDSACGAPAVVKDGCDATSFIVRLVKSA